MRLECCVAGYPTASPLQIVGAAVRSEGRRWVGAGQVSVRGHDSDVVAPCAVLVRVQGVAAERLQPGWPAREGGARECLDPLGDECLNLSKRGEGRIAGIGSPGSPLAR